MAALDRKLMETFSYTDEILDVQKDETIERILSMKKVVAGFSPVHSAVVSYRTNGETHGIAWPSSSPQQQEQL